MKARAVLSAVVAAVIVGTGVGVAVAHNRTGSTSGGSGSASSPASSTPTATDGIQRSISWHACHSSEIPDGSTAVCGTVSVPLDYGTPTGRHIQIAVSMVRHSSSAADYQGAILVNPGGPGGYGLGLSSLGSQVPKGVGSDYDWIGFDPRGVGDSRPLITCSPHPFAGVRPPYDPTTVADQKVWLQRSAAYAAACAKNSGTLLEHTTTEDSARDLDSIRIALGQKQISYYGYSYGTYLGQVYATLFPGHLHRLVLDSNVDPRQVWYEGNLSQDVAFEANQKAFFSWLAKYDSVYRLGASEAAVQATYDAAEAGLAQHPAAKVIGPDEWVDIFIDAGYEQASWANLGQAFSSWVHKQDARGLQSWYRYESAENDQSYPGYLAVQCTDAAWPGQAKTLADNRALAAKAPAITWENAWFNAPCLTWAAPAGTPVTIDGSAVTNALLIDQTHDAATPYEGSLEVRRLFPHAALLALPGGTTHADSLSGDTCEDDLIAAYLGQGTLPARRAGDGPDATCAPRPAPVPSGASSGL